MTQTKKVKKTKRAVKRPVTKPATAADVLKAKKAKLKTLAAGYKRGKEICQNKKGEFVVFKNRRVQLRTTDVKKAVALFNKLK